MPRTPAASRRWLWWRPGRRRRRHPAGRVRPEGCGRRPGTRRRRWRARRRRSGPGRCGAAGGRAAGAAPSRGSRRWRRCREPKQADEGAQGLAQATGRRLRPPGAVTTARGQRRGQDSHHQAVDLLAMPACCRPLVGPSGRGPRGRPAPAGAGSQREPAAAGATRTGLSGWMASPGPSSPRRCAVPAG